ncbi:MAG TPA: arginine--tRNA ligase [Candidatus Saccharimonadales bacterium]|nr:arginine--tRNA ligase [Candidatus Saccharimonadales bacterium]
MEKLETAIAAVIKKLFGHEAVVLLTRPDEQFGDYATNIALQLARPLGKNPREIGETLAAELRTSLGEQVQDVTIAGPGFLNITLSDQALGAMAGSAPAFRPNTYENQVVVAEYSDPNPFKVLHAGHLYTSVVGDALANLFETAGGEVHRVNFGGDVGLHVAKTMWAILAELGGEQPEKLQAVPPEKRSEWMAACYVRGTNAYEEDPDAKAKIVELNKRVYQIQAAGDHDSPLAHIYWTCRAWSYEYFDAFYARIGTKFEKYYPESEVAGLGLETVQAQLKKGVYEQSDGAVVFNGEKYGLHTRVFINSEGLPTYEAKDVGLIMQKWRDYHFDHSVVITGNDIVEYMKVVLKSIEQFEPELVGRTTHLTHGQVKLAGGVKMSSRKGNFLRAVDVLDEATRANHELTGQNNEQTMLAAVKYAFLRQRMGEDIIYDPKESVSLEGNSGPYLQYAHARARSIVRKSQQAPAPLASLQPGERSLARKISEYPEVLERATTAMLPHHICTYLYELAQTFNRFYEHNRVVDDPREAMRLQLVTIYADTLKAGLQVLGIAAPDQM